MNIRTDGNYLLEPITAAPDSGIYAIYVDGALDGASVNVTYKSVSGDFINYENGAMESGDQVEVRRGVGVNAYLSVSGADASTDINVTCAVVAF